VKISIVMAFFNRQELLDRTIKSIEKHKAKDYEIIIVDDGSDVPAVCDKAKVIRIEPEDKWWHNPCIPYNMGFKEATGDVIIIQNPECMHMGNVLGHVRNYSKDGLYISFPCYAINEEQTDRLRGGVYPTLKPRRFSGKIRNGWYNHPIFRPVAYHFCCAITRHDLDLVGGFNEEYAHGISYDDDDFVYSINDKGIKIQIVNDPYVVHQYHPPYTYKREGWRELHEKNKQLFERRWM